jgi:PAP_fibrillin
VAYVDVIYMDDNLRIVRGHRGTTFAFLRVSDK